mmetsp:Transcript_10362/g.18941  ORF Transcript_10362/g.18941 Transcript_10362/m.18941 type:complete len:178 (+) Transcript_10362:409-942(+)|eukprot:CAMPEP_0178878238 /NCGR_PEP_ID=MMETSP0747-20121128/11287_1 /TAXON_ID=913974 /ORGANISM="Nitzschia punctata, Strain CCMP561" /LENGTH=177 /DNA_ID=CAMNT_0020545979 /DNA_START=315 /DNA_END=848 /DNA_ORIENTATION=-
MLGEDVGDALGVDVGDELGVDVGNMLGETVGEKLGLDVGVALGNMLGVDVGARLGDLLGFDVGLVLQADAGVELGETEKSRLDSWELSIHSICSCVSAPFHSEEKLLISLAGIVGIFSHGISGTLEGGRYLNNVQWTNFAICSSQIASLNSSLNLCTQCGVSGALIAQTCIGVKAFM